jgi:peptidoglycan/xylan/chitin deacetylase (PgdA/CDA1 family)
MRLAVLASVAVFLVCSPAIATAPSATGVCRDQTSALGISRVVEVETSNGPQFGHQQYSDLDPLRDGEVALTFDDGPLRPYTQAVLNALEAHCTKATFFIVGRMAVADPEMVKEIARRGHTIGTHTWSHRNLRTLLPYRVKAEIELGFSAVRKAVGGPIAPFFRFPYLSDSSSAITYLRQRQIAIFSIDADAYDYRTRDADTVHLTIMRQLMEKRKGIILFHDIQPSTARALKKLLDDLQARGFRVVHFAPKAAATTLPDYDMLAEKALVKNRMVAAEHPLALRSSLWSTGPKTAPRKGASVNSPPPRAAIAGPALAEPLRARQAQQRRADASRESSRRQPRARGDQIEQHGWLAGLLLSLAGE